MAGVPRSQCLIAFGSSAGNTLSPTWQCPPGYVTLVKQLMVDNESGGSVNIALHIIHVGLANLSVEKQTVPNNNFAALNFWFVLNPGDEVFVDCGGGGVGVWLSGAVLHGSPQFPIAS